MMIYSPSYHFDKFRILFELSVVDCLLGSAFALLLAFLSSRF